MMKAQPAAALFLLAASAVLFVACPTVDLTKWGTGTSDNTTATAVGPVAGFGSILVAGAEFTDNASTTVVDDRGRGLGDLVAGMIATVRGTLNASFAAGAATTVTIEREVRGPADDNGVALDNGTVRVLGQTVVVNPATVLLDSAGFDIGLDALKGFLDNGYRPVLEVHGGVEDNGTIRASYIGWVQDNVVEGDDVELRGTVRAFDSPSRTFRIGTQVVNYTDIPSAGRIDWPMAGLSNGLIVDVRGYLDNDGGVRVVRTDRVLRTGLRRSPSMSGTLSERITLEGYVLSGSSASFELSVPGGTVTVNSDVEPTGDAFGTGRKVRVKGPVRGNDGKSVQASSVFVLKALEVLVEGAPEGLPAAGDVITLLGKTVETDRFTLFRDPSGGVRDGFGLSRWRRATSCGWSVGSMARRQREPSRRPGWTGSTERQGGWGCRVRFPPSPNRYR